MDLLKVINELSRLHNKILMLGLSVSIFILFLFTSALKVSFVIDDPIIDVILVLWIIFSLVSFVYTLNGVLLDRTFKSEINRQRSIGKPLEGVRGYDEFRESMVRARNISVLVTLSSVGSLIIFILSITSDFGEFTSNQQNLRALLITFAMTFAFLSISLLFIIEYPKDLNFNPGGLIGFYEPDIYPMLIDNLMFDVFYTYLDPITLLDIEEWSAFLFGLLSPQFEPDESDHTRLEQARERILLLLYLNLNNTEMITKEILTRELEEIVTKENVDKIIDGLETGLTLWEIQQIIARIMEDSPEPFRLVDRLLVSLTDDYEIFTENELYYTISAKTNQGSVRESTGVLVFFLNNTEREDREVEVTLLGGRELIHPHKQKIKLKLDKLTDPYPDKQPPLISENQDEDILGILSDVLSVGDAVWFRINPNGFGYKVVTIQAETNDGDVMGESIELKFTRGPRYFAKTYLPKLSGIASIALPLIQGYIGFQF